MSVEVLSAGHQALEDIEGNNLAIILRQVSLDLDTIASYRFALSDNILLASIANCAIQGFVDIGPDECDEMTQDKINALDELFSLGALKMCLALHMATSPAPNGSAPPTDSPKAIGELLEMLGTDPESLNVVETFCEELYVGDSGPVDAINSISDKYEGLDELVQMICNSAVSRYPHDNEGQVRTMTYFGAAAAVAALDSVITWGMEKYEQIKVHEVGMGQEWLAFIDKLKVTE